MWSCVLNPDLTLNSPLASHPRVSIYRQVVGRMKMSLHQKPMEEYTESMNY